MSSINLVIYKLCSQYYMVPLDLCLKVSMRGDYSPLLDQKVDSVTKDNVVQV